MRAPFTLGAALLLVTATLAGCAKAGTLATEYISPQLAQVMPGLVLPGSTLVLLGGGYVAPELGSGRLRFDGKLDQTPVSLDLPATFVSVSRLEITVDDSFVAAVGGVLSGSLTGNFSVEILATSDASSHRSAPLMSSLTLAPSLSPTLGAVTDGLTFVNQPIEVVGDGFLLGGPEGALLARLSGCFTPTGASSCGAPVDVTIHAAPMSEFDRTHASFPYATSVSGIGPGVFTGQLVLTNLDGHGAQRSAAPKDVTLTVQPPTITGASTTSASLGEYVVIEGGGFVGNGIDESTILKLTGTYTADSGATRPLNLVLVPEFLSGPELRYVLDESDPLGAVIDLRHSSGSIVGSLVAIVEKGSTKLASSPTPVSLHILPVKQVVYIEFLQSYQSSLRLFGMTAADALIHARVIALSQQIVKTLDIEFRDEVPTDFKLFSVVDIAGPDPNGMGLFGYDNTPGKDVGNLRLYDRIGGVNAVTQEDGSVGYGGVFTESFFSFSAHPNGLAVQAQVEPMFDRIFDPFRPDAGGHPVRDDELASLPPLDDSLGGGCPAGSGDRSAQITCAVWTLGNLIASTMVHEVGHSLGLADPAGPMTTYHNPGDLPDRLMEVGEARPFAERAILGDGPAQFCADEYTYLRSILGTADPETTIMRQACN